MEEAYRDAFSEIYFILDQMSKENVQKISNGFIKFIEKNRNLNYTPNLPQNALMKTHLLKRETKIVLSIMYRNYFCTSEERKKLQKQDEAELSEIYSYDKIFEKKNVIKNDDLDEAETKENTTSQLVDIENMNWIKKLGLTIKQKLFSLFNKN